MTAEAERRPIDLDAEQEVDFGRYWRAIAARWWLLLAGIVPVRLSYDRATQRCWLCGHPFAPFSPSSRFDFELIFPTSFFTSVMLPASKTAKRAVKYRFALR